MCIKVLVILLKLIGTFLIRSIFCPFFSHFFYISNGFFFYKFLCVRYNLIQVQQKLCTQPRMLMLLLFFRCALLHFYLHKCDKVKRFHINTCKGRYKIGSTQRKSFNNFNSNCSDETSEMYGCWFSKLLIAI